MGYSWNSSIIKGGYISDGSFEDFSKISDYILINHCSSDYNTNNGSYCSSVDSSDYSSVNGSYASGCSSNNSSVESTKYSSKCVNTYNGRVHSKQYVNYTGPSVKQE